MAGIGRFEIETDELMIFIVFGLLGLLVADALMGGFDLPDLLDAYFSIILITIGFGMVVLALFTRD